MNFKGKTVCVTGAGGSIGSELCVQLAKLGADPLILVSLTENGLYTITKRLRRAKTTLVPILGSVSDVNLMQRALAGCDIVIHAAAHKHVPICEVQPLAAIDNNVGGTYRLATTATAVGIKTFVLVSSDKAVFPTSVMGATKRVAELIVRDLMPSDGTQFTTVRFGNVLDSAGSVLPLWREQIAAGGPLTLTDPDCERYFMSIPEAVALILYAASAEPNGIRRPFVFDMGEPRKMGTLARELMHDMKKKVLVQVSGLRPGEKLRESLHHGGVLLKTEHPSIYQVAEDGTKALSAQALNSLLAHTWNYDKESALKKLWEIVN